MYASWKTTLKRFDYLHIESKENLILASIGLWFTIFMWWVFLLAFLKVYVASAIIIWFFICSALSINVLQKIWIQIFQSFTTYNLVKVSDNTRLFLNEAHLLIITFLLSINFINVYRPFPIGWDDLWAYMNYPKIIAGGWELIALGQMYLWQLYTGIWFLFWSQTFAFYLNSFSGVVMGVCYIFSINSDSRKEKNTF